MGERILVYGKWGTGKSYQFLKVAKFVAPARCYVLDTDGSYPRMLETEFKGLNNVEVYSVFEREEWKRAIEDVLSKAGSGDWVCVDRADVLWDETQDFYTREVFGEDIGDYFLRARAEYERARGKSKEGFVALDGWKDWGVINRIYRQLWNELIKPNAPFHLYVAATAELLGKKEEPETVETFGWIGYKPGGQKHLPYGVHTVLFFDCPNKGEWRVTTVKDRGRRYLDKQKLVDLAYQYLVGVAGWKVGAGGE